MIWGILLFFIGVGIQWLNTRWKNGLFGGGFYSMKSLLLFFLSLFVMALGLGLIVFIGKQRGQF